jgi:hypothetical protein
MVDSEASNRKHILPGKCKSYVMLVQIIPIVFKYMVISEAKQDEGSSSEDRNYDYTTTC